MLACAESPELDVPERIASNANTLPPLIYWLDADGQVQQSEYEIHEGLVIVEHDIEVDELREALDVHWELAQKEEFRQEKSSGVETHGDSVSKAHLNDRRRRHWDDGVVPFDIRRCNAARRANIATALGIWNGLSPRTGITWVPADLAPRGRGVRFTCTRSRCLSRIGQHPHRQRIRLGHAMGHQQHNMMRVGPACA